MFKNISYSLMDAERLLELFLTKPSITESPNAKPLKFTKGHVRFDGVSFAYDDRKPTLKDVTFSVPSGKTVALVGETGGGKSTILKLIERFYDVKTGTISIDGQDIRDVTLTRYLARRSGNNPQNTNNDYPVSEKISVLCLKIHSSSMRPSWITSATQGFQLPMKKYTRLAKRAPSTIKLCRSLTVTTST